MNLQDYYNEITSLEKTAGKGSLLRLDNLRLRLASNLAKGGKSQSKALSEAMEHSKASDIENILKMPKPGKVKSGNTFAGGVVANPTGSQIIKAASAGEAFTKGFMKVALMDTRGAEDAIVGATSLLPLGTTAHTVLGDRQNKGLQEWATRIGGAILGSMAGAMPGMITGSAGLARLGAMIGTAAGEIGASRLIHEHAYNAKGELKKKK